MNIIRKSPDKYTVHKNGEHHFSLVKILKDYDSDKAALNDLTNLAVGEITERDLLGSNYEQDAEAGKFGNRVNVLEAALEGIRSDLVDSLILSTGDVEKAVREAVKRINGILNDGRKEE
jgi:hypothetical protein